jgi:hypothetical protein
VCPNVDGECPSVCTETESSSEVKAKKCGLSSCSNCPEWQDPLASSNVTLEQFSIVQKLNRIHFELVKLALDKGSYLWKLNIFGSLTERGVLPEVKKMFEFVDSTAHPRYFGEILKFAEDIYELVSTRKKTPTDSENFPQSSLQWRINQMVHFAFQ